MNCPDNDFDDCDEYALLIEQYLALNRLFDDAKQSRRFFMAQVICDHMKIVVERRLDHFDKHYRAHLAKR